MAQNGLAPLVQEDFSGGAFPGYSRDSIPQNGVEDAVNCLITDDGQLARRGGSVYKSNLTYAQGARMLFDGYLAGGQRTVWTRDLGVGSTMGLYALGADDATPYDPGVSIAYSQDLLKPVVTQGLLVVPSSASAAPLIYGGSRGGPGIAIGNVTATLGSTSVSGTALNTKYAVGQLFSVDSTNWYAITAVASGTLTLASPFREATTTTTGVRADTAFPAVRNARIYASLNNRLFACVGDTIYASDISNPFAWQATNYVQLPAGVQILGAEPVRDALLIFTTAGIWALSNTAYDLTDDAGNPQWRLDPVNHDLILWSWTGTTQRGNSLIVPATDGVWLVDSVSGPQRITGGIEKLYRSYVDAGYQTGYGTVFNGHYLLPILDSSYAAVDMLVCRLTPTRRGTAYGWSRLSGDGAKLIGVTPRVAGTSSRQPYLLGAHSVNSRIVKLPLWDQTASADADGTVHQAVVVTREITGDINTLAKKLRIRYELTDPSSVDPTLTAEWAQGKGSYTTLATSAPENTDPSTSTWRVEKRNPHFRLKTVGATSNFTLHSLTMLIRPSGRQ